MKSTSKVAMRGVAACAVLCTAATFSQAATIIKLNLGGIGPDVGMGAPAGQPPGILSTIDQTTSPPLPSPPPPLPAGDQFTDVEYTGGLEFISDLNTNNATFSLNGLQLDGPATVFGALVIQNFKGGNFALYDPSNNLLLAGPLGPLNNPGAASSALTGVAGPPGTGALFTTTLGSFSGGSLASYLVQGTVALSMNLTNVSGGNGFNVVPFVTGGTLQSFVSDAGISISADVSVPEPATMSLVGLASAALIACGGRRRS